MVWPADDASVTPAYIGTSGWSYAHWEHVLYPVGLPPAERLGRYVQVFGTAELNASFYRWPKERTFAGWSRRLPPGFLLSVKAPRGLTHAKLPEALPATDNKPVDWGTDDVKAKGGDYFGAKELIKPWRLPD